MLDVSELLAAMVRDARREPELDTETRARMWAALERRLVSGPPAPTISTAAAPRMVTPTPVPPQKLMLLRTPRAS